MAWTRTILDGILLCLVFNLTVAVTWIFIPGAFSKIAANLPMFRLEGTEHMDKAYHQKWFHVKGMLFPGLIFALIPALIVGWIVVSLLTGSPMPESPHKCHGRSEDGDV